ncbi:hypothetical protein [Micromonospora sp. NPDC005324]|uniref:hypothetical protein n=1 Tax=Micromonospora sp. NPDC005324 TaxID=3157033 RepID=UPI0033B256EE
MAEAVIAADPECRCGDGRWSHKHGSGGCRVMDCPCDKYELPRGTPANDWPLPAIEVEQAEAAGLVVRPESPAADPGLAAVLAEPEPVDEPAPEPVPVVADPVAQAESVEQVAGIDAHLADPEPTDDEVADEIDRAEDAAEIERLTAELDAARREAAEAQNRAGHQRAKHDECRRRADRLDAQLRDATTELEQVRSEKTRLAGQLAPRLADLDQALGEVARLRRELNGANAVRQHAQDALDEAIRTGTSAAANVLYRYDADQCTTEACGSRYTVPVEHPHPLTPVTVLVVRREVPGA